MRGNLLFVLLLLVATGVAAQTDKTPDKKTEAEPAAAATKKHVKARRSEGTERSAGKSEIRSGRNVRRASRDEKATRDRLKWRRQRRKQNRRYEEPQAQTDQDPKLTSVPGGKALGMSILGNQEAPTSLVIVPWKSSEVGRATGISPMLDDSRSPVDKEVFMRELRYYEIRSEKK